jgi:regulator of sirC expression with transglutaminase-like and TPR domain
MIKPMPAQTLEEIAALPEAAIDLPHAALLLAREIAYPDLAPMLWLRRLDELAGVVRPRLAGLAPRACVDEVVHVLFYEYQFRGHREDYHDPRNSFLNDVLARRLGLPITLSLLLIEVGRRAGLHFYGVGLPGHFITAALVDGVPIYLDAFNRGAEVDVGAMGALARRSAGMTGALDQAWLRPYGPRQFLARMCANLQGAYVLRGDWAHAIAATERLVLFSPLSQHLRDLGIMCLQAGELQRAAVALESYLLREPSAEDAQTVRAHLETVHQRLALLN